MRRTQTTAPCTWAFFASAHSCGLRRGIDGVNYNAAIFASAHSCGLRHTRQGEPHPFVNFASAHSCGLRPTTMTTTAARPPFASAHSCGLRRPDEDNPIKQAHFATAHSCGLRQPHRRPSGSCGSLCHSAFVRVATERTIYIMALMDLCHSAFVRVATAARNPAHHRPRALPQRIRAGCDTPPLPSVRGFLPLPQRIRAGCDGMFSDVIKYIDLCHSAFVRVATQRKQGTCRPCSPLPQRIRAGCDCGKAMQRTANLLREGR